MSKQAATKSWNKAASDAARENHIWLNAFNCVRPSEAFCARVGRAVLDMLNNDENLIDSELQVTGRQRELVLRINKS